MHPTSPFLALTSLIGVTVRKMDLQQAKADPLWKACKGAWAPVRHVLETCKGLVPCPGEVRVLCVGHEKWLPNTGIGVDWGSPEALRER